MIVYIHLLLLFVRLFVLAVIFKSTVLTFSSSISISLHNISSSMPYLLPLFSLMLSCPLVDTSFSVNRKWDSNYEKPVDVKRNNKNCGTSLCL